jgi:uncharacterized membrane protein YkgB
MPIEAIDIKIISFFKKIFIPVARLGLFIVFFWFGILKVFGASPASPLVQALFERTVSFMSFDTFLILFGIFECIIGLLFLFRGLERVVIPLLFLHMITTFMPLFLLPEFTWSGFLVPTMEGQYIIKNVVIIALAIGLSAHIHPIAEKHLNNPQA